MFLKRLSACLRAGLMVGVVLSMSSAINVPPAAAQEAAADKAPASSAGRAHIDEVLKGLNRGRQMGQAAVSPDGKSLAWIQFGKDGLEIRVAPIGDLAKSQRVTAAAKPEQHCHEAEIAWAPDAKQLAFFSDCSKPGRQTDLYIAMMDGSPARRLTQLSGLVEAPAFSPDGAKVAFLYVEGATRTAGALAAMKPWSGVIGEDGVEIQRVAVALVAAPKPVAPAMVTPANLHVYEFDWSPDSKSLAYVAADPPGENNWWVAKLYRQELPTVSASPVLEQKSEVGNAIAAP